MILNLSISLNDLNIGGKLSGSHLNHLFYADDVCLISLSTAGMQKLFNLCQDYALSNIFTIYLSFNSKKSMCMKTVPPLTLMWSEISFVEQCKYLGTIIDVKKNSNTDMKRQLKMLNASSNTIIRTFSKCSCDEKIMRFKSLCTNLCCSQFNML